MPKLTDYVKMAADEYLEETGNTELNARWIAEFFQDYGVQDAYPRQDLVAFAEMVQKELTRNEERAAKKMRLLLDKALRGIKSARKL
ncbi:hypothetical protein [Nitrosospira sp. NpAV]|uniref:hypothetical protein n=1 Tax=Nitrosospira sp. NpAV TaxID=58133 RepID=UPI0005A15460|nr:hypothetical protein [Nitrosospira sp. NpAV]KIO48321.1 hypothetical protein SQ11_11125 [Nitrosospira sp. NpAV]